MVLPPDRDVSASLQPAAPREARQCCEAIPVVPDHPRPPGPPRFVEDRMLGPLVRCLRFMGCAMPWAPPSSGRTGRRIALSTVVETQGTPPSSA